MAFIPHLRLVLLSNLVSLDHTTQAADRFKNLMPLRPDDSKTLLSIRPSSGRCCFSARLFTIIVLAEFLDAQNQ